jgi:hypothetical protein
MNELLFIVKSIFFIFYLEEKITELLKLKYFPNGNLLMRPSHIDFSRVVYLKRPRWVHVMLGKMFVIKVSLYS